MGSLDDKGLDLTGGVPSDDAVRRHARDVLEQVVEVLMAVFPYQGAAFRSHRVAILALFEHATVHVDASDLSASLDALEHASDGLRAAFAAAISAALRRTHRDPEETKPDAVAAEMQRHGWEDKK